MSASEARKSMFNAADHALPTFEENETATTKVAKLEDHALTAAGWRADLERGRLYVEEALHDWKVEWEMLEGWEVNLPGGKRPKEITQNDITAAKRNARPDLYKQISDAKHLVQQLSTAIRRLEKDEERGSRVYTFITGN